MYVGNGNKSKSELIREELRAGETSPKKIIHNVREKYGETITRSLVSQIRAQMRDDGINIPKAEPHKGGQMPMDVGYEGFKISEVVRAVSLLESCGSVERACELVRRISTQMPWLGSKD